MKKIITTILTLVLILSFSLSLSAKTVDMGEFKVTAYCPCEQCSKEWGYQTTSEKTAISNHTIAIDPSVINIGDKVKVGNKIYFAEDTGTHVIGDHVDIFFDSHEEVEKFGVKKKHVWIIRKDEK